MIGIKIEVHFSCQLDGVFVLHQRKIFGLAQTNFKNGETLAFFIKGWYKGVILTFLVFYFREMIFQVTD